MPRLPDLLLAAWLALPCAVEADAWLSELPLPLPATYDSPALRQTPNGPILSWLEGVGTERPALRFATLTEGAWSTPETVVRDVPFWLSWADPPWLTALDDGTLVAHWPERAGDDPYDYVTRMALRRPGAAWGEPFLLHDDASPVQHGLATVVRRNDGAREYLWLDARDDAMALYARTLDPAAGRLGPEKRVDAMTCSCCRIALEALPNGELLAAYRDRTPREVRDIRLQRHAPAEGWRETGWHSADGWTIAGCPVNGPALAVSNERIALAWFTAADDRNRVLLVRSDDRARGFSTPLRIDAGDPIGRPSMQFDAAGRLLVAWLEWTPAGTRLFVAVDPATPGAAGRDLLPAPGGFAGYPQLLAHDGDILLFLAAASSARLFRLHVPQ